MNIINILMCPECKSELSEDLKCKGCHNQYIFRNGVFNVVSQKLSGELLQELKETSDLLSNRKKEAVTTSDEYEQNWRKFRQKRNDLLNQLFNSLSGMVCELATGLGSHFQKLLDSNNKDFNIVCVDIEKMGFGLPWFNNPRVFCIVADARYMPVKDNSFDYITSDGAFDNIAESDKVVKEMYRTLKPNGKLIVCGSYIEKHTKSFELAKSMRLEKGVVEEYLIRELETAGFKNIVSDIISEIMIEEQMGILPPVAGDKDYFYIIQAEKY